MHRRFLLKGTLSLSLLSALSSLPISAMAADYPTKSVLTIVPYGAGGGNDILLRLIAKYAQPYLKQSLVIENRPGAGGQIGWTAAAKARPDGYTIVAVSQPSMVLIQELRRNVPFKNKDFAHICSIQADPIVWLVHADSDIKTAQDVVSYAKNARLRVAGDGPQSNVQLQHLLAAKALGITTNFVSFNGSGPALTALLGKKVDLASSSLSAAMKYISAGKLRALVVFDDITVEGIPMAKDVWPDISIAPVGTAVRGVAAPKGVSAQKIALLEDVFSKVAKDPAFLEAAQNLGLVIRFRNAKDTEQMVSEIETVVQANKALF